MAIVTELNCNLQETVKVQYLDGNLFSQDVYGNVIRVVVMDGDEPATLTGTVSGLAIRADGGTVAISDATLSDNVATIVLPAAAYAVPGVLAVTIKISDASTTTTLASFVANVYQTSTETAVDPGTIIPSITALIEEIETVVATIPGDYSTLWASLAPTFSSGTSYAVGQYVTYDGGLYKFKNAHSGSWSSSDVDAVDLGTNIAKNASDIIDLKSALINCNTYDLLAGLSGSIDRTHRGITFAWNSDKSVCHITGTASGGAAHCSIIDSNSAMPQGFNAGRKLKIELSGMVTGVYLDIYWYPNTIPVRVFNLTESTILDIPAECIGVLFRMRVVKDTAMPEGGIDVHIKMYSNYILDQNEYYGFKSNTEETEEHLTENTDGFNTIHYVVNVSDGEIRGSTSTYYNYRAGTPETVSHGIIRCSFDYVQSCYCWDGSTYLGAWTGSGTGTTTSSILWAREFDIDAINKTLEATDLKCLIVAKRNDGATTDIGYGIIYRISKIQQEMIEKAGKRKSINILFIGNSFTEDENDYLPALLKEALPDLDFVIGILYKGGASLEEQWEQYSNESTYARYSEYTNNSASWTQTSNSVTMQDAVAMHPWDVITFQQASSDGTAYSTYQPYLNNLINALQTDIEKNIRFVLMLYHAYAEGYTATGYDGDSDAQYTAISSAVQEAFAKTAVSDVIPTGTAVQNARTTSLDSIGTFGHLSYDGMHLEEGIPCLIPAYVTFLKVCEWIGYKEIGVLGSQILPNTSWVTGQNIPGKNWGGSAVGATEANRLIAAKCAIAAIKNPYQITDCSGM